MVQNAKCFATHYDDSSSDEYLIGPYSVIYSVFLFCYICLWEFDLEILKNGIIKAGVKFEPTN